MKILNRILVGAGILVSVFFILGLIVFLCKYFFLGIVVLSFVSLCWIVGDFFFYMYDSGRRY